MVQDASGYAVRVLGAVLGGIAQRAREKPAGASLRAVVYGIGGGGGDYTRNNSPSNSRLTASCFISFLIFWQIATISAAWFSMSSAAALL